MPLASQTDPRIDADVQNQSPWGCYLVSIVTMTVTALANRASNTPALINRTKDLEAVSAGKAADGTDIPKFIKQISWTYRHQNDGNKGYYHNEAAADVSGGKVAENCDPYVFGGCNAATATNGMGRSFRNVLSTKANAISNKTIIDAMKANSVMMIAYARYSPSATYDSRTQTLKVSLTDLNSRHKVVFSGFLPGVLPLRINDVGDGKRYKVKISKDLNELKFAAPGTPGPIKKIVYPADIQGRSLLIYEGKSQETNPTVLVVEHYDGLRINAAKNQPPMVQVDPTKPAQAIEGGLPRPNPIRVNQPVQPR